MDKLKSLIILSPGFPEDEADTTCLPPQQALLRALKEQFPELRITVIAFQYPFKNRRYTWHGIDVISFGGKNPGRLKRLWIWFRVLKELRNIAGKGLEGVGVLSFWLGECAFVGSLFSKVYGTPHHIWVLGQDAKKGNKYFPLIRPSANELIAVSDFIADEINRNYSVKPLHRIPVGTDTTSFPPLMSERPVDILGAGSLIPLKQFNVFIDVIGELSVDFPAVKAVICGAGPEEQKLQKQIERLNLGNSIKLTGEIPHVEVLKLMQQSKIFLHTSEYEGFGAVFTEALYAGAHVVSFCRPLENEIDHWHIVKLKEELVDQLTYLLEQPDLSHQRVLYYSSEQVATDVMNLFS
ncbi:glycosyltransferase family 4 protein [Flavihumibacter sp. R14]|nr:glycosyltransferase family 4 protein [Flavihumibacter soli]